MLQSRTFRSVGWSTLFECLSIYDEKFKQSLQTAGAMLPEIQEGDAKALVGYLTVLQKVLPFYFLIILGFIYMFGESIDQKEIYLENLTWFSLIYVRNSFQPTYIIKLTMLLSLCHLIFLSNV